MKKTFLFIAALLLISGTAFSQFQFGAGAAFGSKSGFDEDSDDGFGIGFGLHVRGLYSFSDDIAVVGGFTYYLPKEIMDVNFNQMGFNADLNVNFVNDETMKAYFLGGVCYDAFKFEAGGTSITEWGFGFHAGAGVVFDKFFIEAKYNFETEIIEGWKRPGQIIGVIGIYFN